MLTVSNWKITFDPAGASPLVVLDFGQAFEGELKFPWSQQTQKGSPAKAVNSKRYARGNVGAAFEITTIERHASDAAARQWCLDLHVDVLNPFALVTSVLKVEVYGISAHYYEMAMATLDDANPGMRIAGDARTHTTWQFGGVGWSKVLVP